MGELIHLSDHRSSIPRPTVDGRSAFFFDVACPLSYLTAERIERGLGEVEWVAVDGVSVGGPESLSCTAAAQERIEACARAMRLPLMWPDQFPSPAPRALRAAAFACEIGAGSAFALAASRLAFCGGFDLDESETLAEAAAAARVPLQECLAAAGQGLRDAELAVTASALRAVGIRQLPAIRLGQRWYCGEAGLLAACALSPSAARSPLLAPA